MKHIYGIQPILEALNNHVTLEKVWIQKGRNLSSVRDILSLLKENHIPFQWVPAEKIRSMAGNKNHQGVVALISPVRYYLAEELIPSLFEKGKNPFLLILDKITDVRNFGAIARTAECMGVDALVIPLQGNAPIHEDSVRTSAGALLHLPVCREPDLKNTLTYLAQCGITLIAIHEKTDVPLYSLDLKSPMAIILGNEEKGIRPELIKLCHHQACIPMSGKTGSLNVSAAASMALYEITRQRQKNPV